MQFFSHTVGITKTILNHKEATENTSKNAIGNIYHALFNLPKNWKVDSGTEVKTHTHSGDHEVQVTSTNSSSVFQVG